MKTILVFPLRSSIGDCTCGGVTSINRSLQLFSADTTNEEVEEYFKVCPEMKFTAIRVMKNENPIYSVRAEVVFKKPSSEGTYLAGGNFVYTSDSRYKEVTGIDYPISVHDRFESWEMYHGMSE